MGTINTIVSILISLRKCFNAQRKIPVLVDGSISSLEYINELTPRLARFLEQGGLELSDFCTIAGQIVKIEVDLVNLAAKLKKNKILDKVNKVFFSY